MSFSRTIYLISDSVYGWKEWIKMYFYGKPPEYFLSRAKPGFPPVVLIQGYSAKWGFLKPLGDNLSGLGYPVYVSEELGNNLVSIPRGAKIIADLIERRKLKNAVLVGHSKGGLIGKYLLIYYNKENRVAGLVSLAAPFNGSRLASYTHIASAKEMIPGSKVLLQLQKNNFVNKKIITIVPSIDFSVAHGEELVGAEKITVSAYGHKKMVGSRETSQQIIKAIDKLNKKV